MAENLSKKKRDRMISFLEGLKKTHTDDASIRAFNEIENQLRDKKYGLVWEEHSEEVDDKLKKNIPVFCADKKRRLCKDEKLPWNFIIEGDNLQALYLLEKTHKGKVDCIYIDPPYNTGARDWKYNNDYVDKNDAYRHSKWLSMMYRRITIAQKLLNPETGVMIVTIDENEVHHLKTLLEQAIPQATIQMVTYVINPKGIFQGKFSRVEEHALFCFMPKATISKCPDSGLGAQETAEEPRWKGLLRSGSKASRKDTESEFYPILIDANKKKIVKALDPIGAGKKVDYTITKMEGWNIVYPIRSDMSEGLWGVTSPTLNNLIKEGFVSLGKYDSKRKTWGITYLTSGLREEIKTGTLVVTGYDPITGVANVRYSKSKENFPKTVWYRSQHDAGAYGSDLLTKILASPGKFSFPKSLYSVTDVLRPVIRNKKNAIILDFFAGSGTTAHAINLLNSEDGGHRKWILVTNNEISEAEEKAFAKRGIKKGDPEWEAKGIAQYVTWPRTICTIEGKDINGNPLKGNYLGSDISMADGFNANVKYFKCDWTPRKPEDYLLSNALALHIKEMIEIQNAIEIDNEKNVLILNKTDFKNTVLDKKKYTQIQNIWVNQNIIFNAKELKLLQTKGYKYIPKEFFGQELREAAE